MPQWSAPWNAPKPQEQAVIEPTPAVVESAPVIVEPTPIVEEPAPVVEEPVVEKTETKASTKKVEPTKAE